MSSPVQVIPRCSFKPTLHPEYESIKAECDAWLLSFAEPASPAAADFWVSCLFPLLGCLAYAQCAAERVIPVVKLMAWYFISDTDDDDPSVRGCETNPAVSTRRHSLMLACHSGQPLNLSDNDTDDPRVTKGLHALHAIWEDISKDMPLHMQARFVEGTKDYLNAIRLQAQYRKAGRLPDIDEYVNAIRGPTSLVLPCFILLEHALGIELPDETLDNELIQRLHEKVEEHIALVNDVFSCDAEMAYGDYFNLPSVILQAEAAARPGFTFGDALQQAVMMVEEVDKRCVQLMEEVEKSRLIETPGLKAYLEGLGQWMGGNLAWSLKTGRYSHTFSPQGLVRPVPKRSS